MSTFRVSCACSFPKIAISASGRSGCFKDIGETEFIRRHQCPVRSLAAFEKSTYADDWRELMRLYMVRRTRSIYSGQLRQTDPANGRKFLTFEDGSRSYFPERVPRTLRFKIDDKDASDQYARLYAAPVVDAINLMHLPRYGLGNYVAPKPHKPPTPNEAKSSMIFLAPASVSWGSAGPICSSGWKAAVRRFTNR